MIPDLIRDGVIGALGNTDEHLKDNYNVQQLLYLQRTNKKQLQFQKLYIVDITCTCLYRYMYIIMKIVLENTHFHV